LLDVLHRIGAKRRARNGSAANLDVYTQASDHNIEIGAETPGRSTLWSQSEQNVNDLLRNYIWRISARARTI
jgi:hypothetical protein